MACIYLHNVYYQTNRNIKEYKDVFLDTSIGIFKVYPGCIELVDIIDVNKMNKLNVIDVVRGKYGNLYIEEARRTFDNDIYVLISSKFILAIEYVLNSEFVNSTQEFRIIENIRDVNRSEYSYFKELDIVEMRGKG